MVLHIEDWFETSAFSNHLQQFIQVYFSSPQNEGQSFKNQGFHSKNLITGTPVADWRKVSETYGHLKEANIPEAHDSDRVHVLLGTDHAHLNASSRSICGGDLEPVAREKTNKKKCTQEGSLLHRVMMTSTEETFQSLSNENDIANLDTLHYPERNSETKDVWSNISENPEEKSVLLFSRRDVDEKLATNANQDGSREGRPDYNRVCLSAGRIQSRFLYVSKPCT